MKAADICERVPGSTFEHTGGGCFTVVVGPILIGPFNQSGEPTEAEGVYVGFEGEAGTVCETLEAVLALVHESINDAQIDEPTQPGDATQCEPPSTNKGGK